MLQHTHTLPVNPQGQATITLEQLWTGLVLRIVEQTRFTPGLDQVEIHEQSEQGYRRALHFGAHVVHDQVICTPYQSVEFITVPTDNVPSGRLLIRILNTNELSLAFEYSTEFPDASSEEEQQLLDIVKSAYWAADAEMIKIIRHMALDTRH